MVVNSSEELKQSQDDEKDCVNSPKLLKLTGLNGNEDMNQLGVNSASKSNEKGSGKPGKRKRALFDGSKLAMDKGAFAAECRQELDCLLEYYKELSAKMLNLEEGTKCSNNSLVAQLLEESNLSYSKLVDVIFEKLKGRDGVTLAYVRSAVLTVGQRVSYGVTNADADVLEDESELCLWCWETRDVKLLPTSQRGELTVRRLGRKKIHERISALSVTLSVLAMPENQDIYKSNLTETATKLKKTLNAEEIRSLVEKKKQKNDTNMAEKAAAKLKERDSTHDIQKEKVQTEKEIKRLREEAEKEAKRREKEEAECKKQIKKQQEEVERDRRRREREEAELKEQRSLKRQATMMERFLKTKTSNANIHGAQEQSTLKDPSCDPTCKVVLVNATTSAMDNVFSRQENLFLEELRRLHVDGWRKLSCSSRSFHWGVRRKPKTELYKQLKLHESSIGEHTFVKSETTVREVDTCKDFSKELNLSKLVDVGLEKSSSNDHADTMPQLSRKKLLQFDKSNRPAYYGTWSKKSRAVGPRHPLKKDPDLDYDVDSDEEWEEEEPGESLSDCDKDGDELEEENIKCEDEEESEDDFFVPDGYLSENEGVEVDAKSDGMDDDAGSSTGGQSEVSEEIKVKMQQQKYFQTLTEQAIRKNRPLVISNIMHEKSEVKITEDITGTCKIDLMCLQALRMHPFSGDCTIDISVDHCPEIDQREIPQSQNRSNNTPTPAAAIHDSDLLEFASSIQSNSQGISKVIESLQGKFPNIPKSQLRNKVKEIAEYVDNHWQVKKEILDRLGLSTSPGKILKPRGIASYFSKQSQPSEQDSSGSSGSSPQQRSEH